MVELCPPCGLYCGSCKLYLREKCGGCKIKRSEICPIWKCAEEKGLEFCSECDYFPCENNYIVPAIAKEWLDEIKMIFKNT